MRRVTNIFTSLSLAMQFFFAGGLVTLESLGGKFQVATSAQGTSLTMSLMICERVAA